MIHPCTVVPSLITNSRDSRTNSSVSSGAEPWAVTVFSSPDARSIEDDLAERGRRREGDRGGRSGDREAAHDVAVTAVDEPRLAAAERHGVQVGAAAVADREQHVAGRR